MHSLVHNSSSINEWLTDCMSQVTVVVDRPFGRPTGTGAVSIGVRSTDRSTEGRSVDGQSNLLVLSGFELRFWSGVESNCGFL